MSDAPREEEIYQALAPGGTYKSGLVSPVAAQQETTVSIPMRFKGAMGGGAVGNQDYPDHEPRASVPYKHYKDLEDVDPKLHEAVTHVADEIHIPRTDLASLVYANSDYNPNARNGARTGYMGLTPDDARQLDPEGHLDINDPIDNLFLGAMKYKRISNRFGMGTPNAFAAYHGGGDRIHTLLNQDPDEHRRMAPDGTFDFLNKVLGRGEGSGSSSSPTADDAGGGGDDQGGDVASMAAAAQAGQQPQRFVPAQGAVPPMYPNDPAASAALTYGSLPSQVSPYRSYEGPPEAPRPAEQGTYAGPPEGAPRAAIPPYYPQEISRPQGAGAGRQPDASQPTMDALRDRERIDQATPVPPPYYSRGSQAPRQPNYNLDPNAPPPGPSPDDTGWQRPIPPAAPPPDDTGWQRPIPPGPPVDDTNWQRPLPPPELTGQGGILQPAPVKPDTPEDPHPRPAAPPDTSGGYAVGGAIGSGVRQYADQQADQPAAQPAATTGSGAPPSPAAPAPARQQAIGADNSAAELNRQELARVTGATPTTGSGGPTSTTAPSAGGDTGVPANLPAGAPKALAPPGSAPSPTAAPPIDRLQGNGGAMTPASAVRAGAQGPGGVLTHIARNGPRGMSIGDGWDHFQDLLERAMIMKGDINGLQHAQEYVFRMKHKGAMENMMQAIASMDDPETAVRFLAKSHAFVTDGTAIGFQVLNNQIFGQKYDEQTHDKIGKPFQVTEEGLRKLALAYSPPDKFNAALNQERQTNETGRHNRKQEKHQDEELGVRQKIADQSLQERKIEHEITNKRLEEAAAQRKAEKERDDERARTLQKERLAEQADQRERDRQNRQDVAGAAARERADRDAERRAEAERVRLEKQHDTEQRDADRKAAASESHNKTVNEDLSDIAPQIKETYKEPASATKARQMYMGIRRHNPDIDHQTGQDYMHGLMTNKYSLHEAESEPGKKGGEDWVYVRDKDGNELARVPRRIWAPYLPSRTEPSTSTRPPPRAPR